jgi:hypothetical protein
MTSIADSAVTIQVSSHSVPSTPAWLGEVVLIVHSLRKQNVPSAIAERVRFARRSSLSAVRKVLSYVPSLTAQRWQWVQASSAVASWWRRIPQDRAKPRVGVARDGIV